MPNRWDYLGLSDDNRQWGSIWDRMLNDRNINIGGAIEALLTFLYGHDIIQEEPLPPPTLEVGSFDSHEMDGKNQIFEHAKAQGGEPSVPGWLQNRIGSGSISLIYDESAGSFIVLDGGDVFRNNAEVLLANWFLTGDDRYFEELKELVPPGHPLNDWMVRAVIDPDFANKHSPALSGSLLAYRIGSMKFQGMKHLKRMGLISVKLAGKSYNAGRKQLEAAGFKLVRTTDTGRRIFVNPRTGATVTYDSGRALGAGQKPHWTIQDRGGQFYDRSGRPVSGPNPPMGGQTYTRRLMIAWIEKAKDSLKLYSKKPMSLILIFLNGINLFVL